MRNDKEKQKDRIATATALQVRDKECEEAVLGTLLSDVRSYDRISEYLSTDCFYEAMHREIYTAIVALHDAGEPIDILTVKAQLSKMGSEITPYDVARISGEGKVFDQEVYAIHLKELEMRRKFWLIGQEMVCVGSSEVTPLDEAQTKFKAQFESLFDLPTNSISTMREGINELYSLINDNLSGKNTGLITKTGFRKLDDVGGLRPSDLVIVAGDTSQGKTSFAQALTLSAMQQGKRIAFYSMEMTRLQLCARLVAAISGVPSNRITDRSLSTDEIQRVDKAVGALPIDNLYFDDRSSSNIDTIISSVCSMKIKHDISGAVIDYAQILTVNAGKQANVEQQLGEAARRLKNLAKELNIYVVLLSQLARNNENPLPSKERLRGSGQMAEAADVVLLVYRPEVYGTQYPKPHEAVSIHGTAMIRIAKNRNGSIGDFICKFDADLTSFYDTDSDRLPIDAEQDPFADF